MTKLQTIHILKLLNKLCKYEMDPMSIVEDTDQTRFYPQTDKWTVGRTEKVEPVYPSFNFVEAEGIITELGHKGSIGVRVSSALLGIYQYNSAVPSISIKH